MILTNPKERVRFVRFAVVGAIGFVVDFLVFNLLSYIFSMPAIWASVFSFTAAVISNFSWNRLWTYPDSRSKRMSRQIWEFAAVSVLGLLLRTLIFALVETPFVNLFRNLASPLPLPPTLLGHNLALAFTVGVIMFWNFYINRYWTFADVDRRVEGSF